MSKEITMCCWCSVIPTKMYKGWVKKKWIPNGYTNFVATDEGKKSHLEEVLEFKGSRKVLSPSCSMKKRLVRLGWKSITTRYVISEKRYYKMRDEVSKWYDKVFEYVTDWFEEHGYIKLKGGSFNGGFCVELDPEREVVKNWGAPLQDKGNKVTQIKEKFGYIVVYLDNLSAEQTKEIAAFAKKVEKKYDCQTRFN